MTNEETDAIRERDRAFSEWRKRKADEMPALAARVFALRGKSYLGHGFRWSLERDLGTCIARLNDYDEPKYYHTREAIAYQIGLEVIVELLGKRVAEIERELSRKGVMNE